MTDAEYAELQEYRSQDLLQHMHQVSEDHSDAGWYRFFEQDLYLLTFCGVPSEEGLGAVPSPLIAEIKRLGELTQVWWVHSETGAESSITLAEAERRFAWLDAETDDGATHVATIAAVKQSYQESTSSDWDHDQVAPGWGQSTVRNLYRLRARPLVTLVRRVEKDDWELRFGPTTVDYVKPAWAMKLRPIDWQ